MRLDHLLASDALGTPLDEARSARARGVLRAFGFQISDGSWTLDDTFAWVTVSEGDGPWHVHVSAPLPEHLVDQALAALDGLVREAALVRIDPLTRREVPASDWSRLVAAAAQQAGRKRFP